MTKAILVIDMPEDCYDCNYCYFDGGYRHNYYGRTCILTGEDVQENFDITTGRHKTCPLKPMPEKSCHNPFGSDVGNVKVNNAFIDGFNACIDEILGEV